jgi:hypothetical protein
MSKAKSRWLGWHNWETYLEPGELADLEAYRATLELHYPDSTNAFARNLARIRESEDYQEGLASAETPEAKALVMFWAELEAYPFMLSSD